MKTLMVNSSSVEDAMDIVDYSNIKNGDTFCRLFAEGMILDHIVNTDENSFSIQITETATDKTKKIFVRCGLDGITITVF